ncbi:MAG TPA: universal stress protein, partial [Miltoncostaeaceae bacterium]|nr:universal stress protein [Miltoncostaeaceae bacterium]
MTAPRRVLVVTDHERRPDTALGLAGDLARTDGEVVLAAILVVPHSQPLEATLERSVSSACGMLDEAERASALPPGSFDTRLVRARSLAEGVLETLAAERFDLVLVEKWRGGAPRDRAAQDHA